MNSCNSISLTFFYIYIQNHMSATTKLSSGGLVEDHERYNATTALLSKGLEERPAAYSYYDPGHGGGEEIIQTSGTNIRSHQVSQTLLASSSPRSCITTSLGSNMLDFSNTTVPPAPDLKNHHSDNSSEVSNKKKKPRSPICRIYIHIYTHVLPFLELDQVTKFS